MSSSIMASVMTLKSFYRISPVDFTISDEDWKIQLVGKDGIVSTAAFPLALFSPMLRGIFDEHRFRSYILTLHLPNFSSNCLQKVVELLHKGTVAAKEEDLLEISDVIDVLKLQMGDFTIRAMEVDCDDSPPIQSKAKTKIDDSNESTLSTQEIIPMISIEDAHANAGTLPVIIEQPQVTYVAEAEPPVPSCQKAAQVSPPGTTEGTDVEAPKLSRTRPVRDIRTMKVTRKSKIASKKHNQSICPYCLKVFESHPGYLKKHYSSCKYIMGMDKSALLSKMAHQKSHTEINDLPSGPGFEVIGCELCKLEFCTTLEKIEHECKGKLQTDEKFYCTICGKTFDENCILLVHKQQHVKGMELQCPICSTLSTDVSALFDHVRKHTTESDPDFVTPQNHESVTHKATRSISRRLTKIDRLRLGCNICKKEYSKDQIGQLLIHEQMHSGISKCVCPFCEIKYSSTTNTLRHMKYMHKIDNLSINECRAEILRVDKFVCGICDVTSTTLAAYTDHRSQHFNYYECPFCDEKQDSLDRIVEHIQTKHEDTLLNKKCEKCDIMFPSIGRVMLHTQMHKNMSQSVCPLCSQKFLKHDDIVSHIQNHILIKSRSWRCIVCSKSFQYQKTLALHTKVCGKNRIRASFKSLRTSTGK